MRTLLSMSLNSNVLNESNFDEFTLLSLESERLNIDRSIQISTSQYESIVESAMALESIRSLVEDHPSSLESLKLPIDIASHGYIKEDVSLEGISSFLSSLWNAIVKTWTAVKDAIVSLIRWITGKGGKAQGSILKKADRNLEKDDTIDNDGKIVNTTDVVREYTEWLIEREKELIEQTKSLSQKDQTIIKTYGDILDKYGSRHRGRGYSEDQKRFNKLLDKATREDIEIKVRRQLGTDYVKDVKESVEATEALAKQTEKTVKARDDLQSIIERKITEVTGEEETTMIVALKSLQTGPETKSGRILTHAVKTNAKAVKDIARKTNDATLNT